MWRIRRASAGLVVMALGALLGGVPGTAYSASERLLVDVPGDGLGFVTGSTAPLLDFSGLEPGHDETGTLSLWNYLAGDVELGLAVVDANDTMTDAVAWSRSWSACGEAASGGHVILAG